MAKTIRPSGTWEIPSRTISCGFSFRSGFPSKRISPWLGGISPEMARSVVLFPAPLAPTSVTIPPSSTDMEMPFRAWIDP